MARDSELIAREPEGHRKGWIDYRAMRADKRLPTKLDIPEPPCKDCVYWHPHRKYVEHTSDNSKFQKHPDLYSGIACCVAAAMYRDFSCYANKDHKND